VTIDLISVTVNKKTSAIYLNENTAFCRFFLFSKQMQLYTFINVTLAQKEVTFTVLVVWNVGT